MIFLFQLHSNTFIHSGKFDMTCLEENCLSHCIKDLLKHITHCLFDMKKKTHPLINNTSTKLENLDVYVIC